MDEAHWHILGASVCGAAHVRAGRPNQDALAWLPTEGAGSTLVLALADGHGSARYFRSDVGAQLAVSTASTIVWELLHSQHDSSNLSALKRMAEERLPQALVRAWEQAVQQHLAAAPFSDTERHTLAMQRGANEIARLEAHPVLAYGTTLLIVAVTPACIIYLQLGDGDMLTVTETGEVARPPIPADARLFANDTTSLCAPDAWRDCRVYFQTLSGPPPALILVATDGYGNSFRDEAGFLAVGTDLLDILRTDGLPAINTNLPTWLTEASQAGSGDDITVGLLYRAPSSRDAATDCTD